MRKLAVLAVGLAAIAAACTSSSEKDAPESGRSNWGGKAPVASPDLALISALESFDSCDAILNHLKAEARKRVTAYGLPDLGGGILFPVMAAEDATSNRGVAGAPGAPPTTVAPSSAEPGGKARETGSEASPSGEAPTPEFSETNVQEAGVDEPDLLKTDGTNLYTLLNGQLTVFEVRDGTPTKVGALALPDVAASSQHLLLSGDRLLALGQSFDVLPMEKPTAGSSEPAIAPEPTTPGSVITQIDISNPAAPLVTGSIVIDGDYVNARLIDGVARIVIESEPAAFAFVYPSDPGNKRSEEIALEANRRIIDESTIEDWLPAYTEGTGSFDRDDGRPLLECDRVSHPKRFSGFGMLSILTIDLDEGIDPSQSVGILANGDRVHASKQNLYVSTTQYVDPSAESGEATAPTSTRAPTTVARQPEQSTAIHKFDISGTGSAVYRASGSVPGLILNDFAMSEFEDHLRVATTERVGGRTGSESFVTVLRETDGELAPVGQVGGLGKGEEIKAVRFIGKIGYVVTFRQTDPLYTVDLAQPESPQVRGELKVLGYSAYLHPISETRLLGIGQDATDRGRTLGTQVALYDVSDPANPRELQKVTLPGSQSEVEGDYHAFLWWAKTKLALVPVQSYGLVDVECPLGAICPAGRASSFVGVIGYTVDDGGIRELGRIANPSRYGGYPGVGTSYEEAGASEPAPAPSTTVACPPDARCAPPSPAPIPPPVTGDPILRSAVIGDTVFTLSYGGVQASDLATLQGRVFVPFV